MKNYNKLTEIEVYSQAELDDIPIDFAGIIYIKFGTPYNRAIVNKRYKRSVVARENSSVVARENSSVEAWGNSSVVGNGNAQIVDKLTRGKIQTSGNARIVHNPKTINEYCEFYNIEHAKNKVTLYKAVHKRHNSYFSNHDTDFEYVIGKSVKSDDFDNNIMKDCGSGIHLSYKEWAVDFGRSWNDLAILECESDIDSIVVPQSGAGKVRAPEVKVIREMPLEECGLLGKIIQKRRAANDLQKQQP